MKKIIINQYEEIIFGVTIKLHMKVTVTEIKYEKVFLLVCSVFIIQ